MNLLLNYDADIGFTNMLGWTALHCACAQGHTAIVQILMLKWKVSGCPNRRSRGRSRGRGRHQCKFAQAEDRRSQSKAERRSSRSGTYTHVCV